MININDIRRFKDLFSLWLEAKTDLEQEKQLMDLADKLSDSQADPSIAKDVALIKAIGESAKCDDESQGKALFMQNIDAMIDASPRPRSFNRWLIASVAASLLAIISVGTWLYKTSADHTTDSVSVNLTEPQKASQSQHSVLAKAEISRTSDKHEPATAMESSTVNRKSITRTNKAVTFSKEVAPESEELVPREVTDPNEAAEIVNESYELLTRALSNACENMYNAERILIKNFEDLNNGII